MRSSLTLVLSGLFLCAPLSAQTARITGRVTDAGGRPLAAVRVDERGTMNQTLTNAEGRYEIQLAAADAVLVFSQFGYRTQEMRPAGGATLDVVLVEAAFSAVRDNRARCNLSLC
jgi:hypothetical protein